MDEIEIRPDLERLKGYTQLKQALADQLRLVRQGLSALGRAGSEKEIEELMVKLAEDRFVLAVVGQFKRGKSSLMNAIIGQELLPTGVLPLTNAITVLRYGPAPMMLITRRGFSFEDRRPLSELTDFVTERGNPGNAKGVLTVRIELPVPFLRYGIEFVDTPGIGSAITANTATTYDFLPQCDAVLFVTAADSPMTSGELEFLKDIRPHVSKLFFVINKIDLLTAKEREEVHGFVAETVEAATGETDLKLFSVSSKQGLDARRLKNRALYEHSGLRSLEEDLGAFLSREKSTLFLKGIIRRTMAVVDREKEQGAFSDESLRVRAEAIAQEKVKRMLQAPPKAAAAVQDARAALGLLANRLDIGFPASLPGEAEQGDVNLTAPSPSEADSERARQSLAGNSEAGVQKPESGIRGQRTQDLTDEAADQQDIHTSFEIRGCPVCAVMAKRVEDFLIQWQYELSSQPAAQDLFANELGFCALHTWQLMSISSPYGASVGYARLADTMAGRLREQGMQEGGRVGRLVRDGRTCRVCELARDSERQAIAELATRLKEESDVREYAHSQGACLKHLGLLIDVVPSPDLRQFLLTYEAERFAQDAEDMRSYALKRDALRRSMQNTDEEDAYRRMMERLAGDRRVTTPWPEDGEI